ncbi:MAG: type I restriction enzyme HsdR N-terminal domain-containing protein [Phocaeicola sp.]
MLPLNLPSFSPKITTSNGKKAIYDPLRRKYIILTPEEWVRQHFTRFLVEHKGYPKGLLANEVELTLNGMKRRCDTVLYARDLSPRMIIEYKAPQIEINQSVFDQISRYNLVLKVEYLIVSNGLKHYCCRIDYTTNSYHFLSEVPDYSLL